MTQTSSPTALLATRLRYLRKDWREQLSSTPATPGVVFAATNLPNAKPKGEAIASWLRKKLRSDLPICIFLRRLLPMHQAFANSALFTTRKALLLSVYNRTQP